mgnify:CR=1 FL=1
MTVYTTDGLRYAVDYGIIWFHDNGALVFTSDGERVSVAHNRVSCILDESVPEVVYAMEDAHA